MTRNIFIALTLILLLPANTQSQQIKIVSNWGFGSRDQLDTKVGTFKYDRIPDLDITIRLTLTSEQEQRVLAFADSISFFDYPSRLELVPELVDSKYEMYRVNDRHPCSHILPQIVAGNRKNQVKWDDCIAPQDMRHGPLDENHPHD